MRLRVVRLCVLSVVLALAGVSSAQAAARILVGNSDPAVTPVLDQSRSSSATIGPGGGSLSTATANGTVLRLTLPRGALAGTEPITMTPLRSLARTGMKLVGGVQLAPAGLQLLKPAVLYVTPANGVPIARQAAFAYQRSGSQFGLVPFELRSRIAIPVLWFGGAGLAKAAPGQLAVRAARRPSDPQSAWLGQLALPAYQLRMLRAVSSSRQAIGGLLAAFYGAYVKPLERRSGSSIGAWTQAAARSIAWERVTQLLGFARQFAGGAGHVRSTVFGKALRKRWRQVTAACAQSQQTLTHLSNALRLGRVAERIGVSSRLGGTGAIAGGIGSCAQLTIQSTLNLTNSNWQSGISSTYLDQIETQVQTGSTALALQQLLGSNQFSFGSAHTGVTERLTEWTLSPSYQAQGCAEPSFTGFTTDPNQMFAAFAATLTVPADLFLGAPPPSSLAAVTVSGADLANWTMFCPDSGTTSFSQAPGAMSGLAAVTPPTPINVPLTAQASTARFSSSADILSGGTVTAFANEGGSVTVTVPQ